MQVISKTEHTMLQKVRVFMDSASGQIGCASTLFDETVINDRAVLTLFLPVRALEPPQQSRICTAPH